MSASKIVGRQVAGLTLDNSHLALAAGILTSKLAEGSLFTKSDGSVPFTAAQAGVDPTLSSHLATKNYVDAVATGLDVKASVRVATTANIALTGLQTIDGVSVVAGDRVLVKNQTTGAQNGIYVVAAGAWARAADADANAEVTSGLHTFVEQGTVNNTTGWVLNTPNPIVVGTTALTFAQFSGNGSYSAGAGLTLTGSQFNVVSANGGIVASAGQVALTLADSTLTVGASGLKLSALNSGNLLVGNASNVATSVAVSGDATLSNAGVLTLNNSAVTTAKLSPNAVDETKTKRQAAGAVLVGQGAGSDVSAVTISGDATLSQSGVLTISGNLVRTTDFITNETPVGSIDGSNTTFTLANVPRAGLVLIYNGQILEPGSGNDYTISGATITTLFTPSGTDKLRANYIK